MFLTLVNGGWDLIDRFAWIWSSDEVPMADGDESELGGDLPDTAASTYYNGGYGPVRDLFVGDLPPAYVALNSFTDNPAHGFEPNFVQVRHVDRSNATYADEMLVKPGDVVIVYAYVHNNTADNLAGPAATTHGLTARAVLGSNSEVDHWVSVVLSAKNATSVWDGAVLVSREPTVVTVVPDSAVFHTPGPTDGERPEGDLEEGVLLGYDQFDGQIPVGRTEEGAHKGAGYLTFRLLVEAAS